MKPNITLCHGDSIPGMAGWLDHSFDYCFTDPPYNVHYKSGWRKQNPLGPIVNDYLPPKQFQDLMEVAFTEVRRLLAPGAVLHVCGGWLTADLILPVLKGLFQLKGCVVWNKVHQGLGWWVRSQHEFVYVLVNGHRPPPDPDHRYPDIWAIPRLPTNRRLHVCEKPVDLVLKAMQPFTLPESRVLDPFMGSAPVAEACWRTGRDFVGWEIDPVNYAAAQARMSRLGAQVNGIAPPAARE